MIMEIISIVGGMIFLILMTYTGGDRTFALSWFIDFPTLLVMVIFVVPVLMRGGMWKDFKRAFQLLKKRYDCRLSELRRTKDVLEMIQKQIWYAGILTMMVSIMYIMVNISDPSLLGPNIAISILTLFYTVVLEMLLLPLQLEVKRRIINYMDLESDLEAESVQIVPDTDNDRPQQ
jgi:MFS family permease